MRTLASIWIGVAAGVYGFDGLVGLLFYFLMDLVLGGVMCLSLRFSALPYFQNLRQVFTVGLMGNFMTFMVMWVLAYNIVYIL